MSPCYCNLFFSFVVVLFFASVASNYLCPENFCPEKNQVCFNFRCLKSCPATTYVYNKNCVKNCPNGLFSNGKECVIHCPLEKPLIQDGHCQSYCTFGRVLSNGTCAIGCPIDTFLYTNSCVDVCPNTHNLTLNSTIVARNKNHQVVTNYALTCVNECPETTVKTTNSCLLQCPERMILFNRSCVHNCPSSHPIVLIRSSTLNSIPTCVEKCPLNQFIFIKTCVPHCPPDTLIRNGTCVKNCSHTFPFLCERGKCTNDLIDYNTNSRGQCLSTCPKKHTLLQKNCFQYCYLSPWRYRLNDTCVSECPANLTYLDIHKPDEECVNMCPNGTVQLENECRTRCPLNMIPVKGKCYTDCPEMYPYRHETYNYPYIRNLKEIACVKSCPPGTFHYKKQCLQNCPNEAPAVQNRTCMKNCTDQFPFTCTRNKCFSPYPIGAVQCLTKCPPNHKRYGQECFRHCYDTPLKYLENGTCVYGCSKNLSIGIEKQCVDSCLGRYKYMYQDSCVENCPENTFSFNKVCYVSCPPEYPNRYVYKTGVWKVVTHITCRKLCPHGTVSYNRTCEKHCPTGWFIFNSSCVEQCPSSNSFHYTMFGSVNENRCVSERPKYALEMNSSFYNRCPDAVKLVFNGTCFSNCPENYPYSQLVSLNDKIATECVHVCKDNTVLWNQTCLPNCPSGLLVYKGECVSSCPKDASVIYEANRKFMESPMSQALTEEASLFCSRYCKRVDGFENLSAPCIYQGQNGYHLLERICQHMENSKSFESIVRNCITLSLFERNGTFFERCPNQLKQTRRACVDECPSSEPFYDSNSRRCMTRCVEKQFTHKNDCVKECPRKTLIINSVCMDIEKCPSDTPLFLAEMDGNHCVKRCPDNYFLDGNACVKKCRGKMILEKTCTFNCTKTHPYVMTGEYSREDIPECFQVCPGDYIGNVTSFECIHGYDCRGFVFNKRCYTKCPDHTITVINWNNGNSKMCRLRFYLQIELLIYFLIALVFVLPSILCMCVEKGTPTKCLRRFQSYIDQHSKSQGTMDDENEYLFDSDPLVDDQIQSEVAVEDIIERCSKETSQQNCKDDAGRLSHLQDVKT